MRLFLQSAMIFFGTLLAAGVLALAEPQAARFAPAQDGADRSVLLVLQGSWPESAGPPTGR